MMKICLNETQHFGILGNFKIDTDAQISFALASQYFNIFEMSKKWR